MAKEMIICGAYGQAIVIISQKNDLVEFQVETEEVKTQSSNKSGKLGRVRAV